MWRNRLVLFAILFLIISLITVPFSSSPTFATDEYDDNYSNDRDYVGKTKLRFYQIFASQDFWNPLDCEDAKNSFLRSNTIEVLRMYHYLPIISQMECVKVTGKIEPQLVGSAYGLTLEPIINRTKDWHPDILIIVLDHTFSPQFKEVHEAWGHIVYFEKIKTETIVTTTNFWDGIEQPTATRTMAHELAHFAVFEKYGWELASGTVKNNVCFIDKIQI